MRAGVRHGAVRALDTAIAPVTRPAGIHDTAPLRPRHSMRARLGVSVRAG